MMKTFAEIVSTPFTTDGASAALGEYIETISAFISAEDPPLHFIFPELLPRDVVMLLHGEPRARKSLAAFELALAAATGTAPFGLARFTPPDPVTVLYVQEEDPRSLTRPRLRALVQARGGDPRLHVAVRRGVSLDDPLWVERLVTDLRRLGAKLLVLDAARRLWASTDEGPAKVRDIGAVLRHIVVAAGVTVVVVHHDVKPPQTGTRSASAQSAGPRRGLVRDVRVPDSRRAGRSA
jgi:RecA-family ATPase